MKLWEWVLTCVKQCVYTTVTELLLKHTGLPLLAYSCTFKLLQKLKINLN